MYGIEIRRKVLELVSTGKTQEEVGQFLNITTRTIRYWIKRNRDEQSLEPKNHAPRKRKIDKEALTKYIQENPDKTLKEMSSVFKVCSSAIFYSLKKLSITLKKRPRCTPNGTKKSEKNSEKLLKE
jgi:transposase